MTTTTALIFVKGVSAGRYLAETAETDGADGIRYLITREANNEWRLRVYRTHTVGGVVVIKDHSRPVCGTFLDTLREAKAVAQAYANLDPSTSARLGSALRTAFGQA